MTTLLSDLPNGTRATVVGVCANGPDLDADQLRRLGELGRVVMAFEGGSAI